jgi:hypothetical protein
LVDSARYATEIGRAVLLLPAAAAEVLSAGDRVEFIDIPF